jgi:hypothetical protein
MTEGISADTVGLECRARGAWMRKRMQPWAIRLWSDGRI